MSPHIPSELPHAPEQPDAGESAALAPSEGAPLPASEGAPLPASEGAPSAAPEPGVAHALELFNSSDQPARIAGIARALGAPCVTVQAAGDAGGRVTIVVAWELCWYRYQLDLAAPAESLALVDRGTELDELAPHERAGGVLADELGRLSATLA
jgi:hypothetical protein